MVNTLFDQTSDKEDYNWALVGDSHGNPELAEFASTTVNGRLYNFQLVSGNASSTSDTFTETNYLSLTVSYVDADGRMQAITYDDQGGDGDLDAVYINNKPITNQNEFIEAQNQYIAELVLVRNYLLGIE